MTLYHDLRNMKEAWNNVLDVVGLRIMYLGLNILPKSEMKDRIARAFLMALEEEIE